MADRFAELSPELAQWWRDQPVFFVATAPAGSHGHVNCSPKGLDTLRILGPDRLAYLDLTGSGAETIAHVRENGRITLMACAFAGPPRISRVYGRATVHESGTAQFAALAPYFPEFPGARAVIEIAVASVTTSCGYGVPELASQLRAVALRDFGPAVAPMNAFLTITGMETLALRMERHVANAQKVAEFLDKHPKVAWVSYAGLPGSKYKSLAQKYLPKGAGAVFTFGLKGGFAAGIKLVESVKLFSHLANVGDTRSLILHPASTTHRQLTEEQQIAAGAGPDVVRLSVGIEDAKDLIRDIDEALNVAG